MVNLPSILAFLDGIGGPEMLVIFALSLMLFGGKKLPEVARGLGKAVREFKRAASGVEDEIRRAMDMESGPHGKPAAQRTIAPPRKPTAEPDHSQTPDPVPAPQPATNTVPQTEPEPDLAADIESAVPTETTSSKKSPSGPAPSAD